MFKDDWLITARAAKLFLVCSVGLIAVTPIFLGWVDPNKMSAAGRISWEVLGIVGAVGTTLLWLGMWRYWLRIDRSRAILRRFWFVILLLGAFYGSCLYYYFVYLPKVVGKDKVVA